MEEIHIFWEGPFSVDEIVNGEISDKNLVKITDIGLYQIYGSHPLYGDDVLLYIGQTTESFKDRLKSSRWEFDYTSDSDGVKIYLGTIISEQKLLNKSEKSKKTKKSETLLINAMKPALNSKHIKSAKNNYGDFIIYNSNNYKNLYPILDTHYFWNDMLNIQMVDKIAKTYGITKTEEFTDNDSEYSFCLPKCDIVGIGVDYSQWDNNDIPLSIFINKTSINKKIKKELSNKFKINNSSNEYCYIPACDDIGSDDAEQEIKKNLDFILDIVSKKNIK